MVLIPDAPPPPRPKVVPPHMPRVVGAHGAAVCWLLRDAWAGLPPGLWCRDGRSVWLVPGTYGSDLFQPHSSSSRSVTHEHD